MNGVERIQAAFARARAEGRAAFMPYHPMGYPSQPQTLEIICGLAQVGADLFEIGIPFSDPLADGPTVQAATDAALAGGTTVAGCLEMVRALRTQGVDQPFCAMGYFNPIYRYGVERFVADAQAAGIDGLIVPDLPPEEAGELETACRQAGLATIFLLAPTSTETRVRTVAAHSTGFIYLVSVTGITGARAELPANLRQLIEQVRRHTELPIAVGFGISSRAQAATVAEMADGVIVGSALVKAAGADDPVAAVRALGAELAAGARGQRGN